MTDLQPLPKEMLAGPVEDFINALPVESVEVTDRHGPRDYGPPEPQDAPQGAAEEPSGVVTPDWAQSAPEAPQGATGQAIRPSGDIVVRRRPAVRFSQPAVGQPDPPAPVFNQPREQVHLHQMGAAVRFEDVNPTGATEGRDLTLEERVEWLEGEVARLARRLQGTLDANNLWDGS